MNEPEDPPEPSHLAPAQNLNPYATPDANLVPSDNSGPLNSWELASRRARLGGAVIDTIVIKA